MTSPTTAQRISLQSVVVVGKDQVTSDLPGEAVILHVPSGKSFALAHVGARVWQLLREPTCVADLRNTIMQEYDVPVERCEADVLALLHELATQGLLDVASDREPAASDR